MRLILVIVFFFVCISNSAQNPQAALLPMPNHIEQTIGKPFRFIVNQTSIHINDKDLSFEASTIQEVLQKRTGFRFPIANSPKNATIQLQIDNSIIGSEHYILQVDQKGICIKGSTPAAVFYGIMTLDQVMLGDICATQRNEISPIRIDDAPRFKFRALMIDPARHFLPVNDVKFFIDQMARYKYNTLQLHLTDDQGWRLEIKKHPTLTGKEYYTQEDIKELIRYAARKHIEIIPEFDIPGHTVALLAAYPKLGCTSTDSIDKVVGKSHDLMLCASQDAVYAILQDIISEVASLFPSPYIHLGGDEAAIHKNWETCDRCGQLMIQKGYDKPSQLMIPFFDRVLSYVRQSQKKAILWCELDKIYPPANEYLFPYPDDVTLVSWRYGLTPKCQELTARHNHPLIMAPGEYAYLDYPQLKGDFPEFDNWGMPVTTLEKCYQLDPGFGKPEAEQAHILGVLGTLWGEAIRDVNRLTYMTYPRGLALAEAGWTQMEYRNWESFKQRIYPNLLNLMQQGVSIRVPFEIIDRNKSVK